MENTGRIQAMLNPIAQRILYPHKSQLEFTEELWFSTEIDRAHLVMLGEQKILEKQKIKRLLTLIEDLRARRFLPLYGRPCPRGTYLMYENYLIEQLGANDGGALHIARSRNDMNATIIKMRLRYPCVRLLLQLLRLQRVLMRRAKEFSDTTMPIYTHYQAAVPVTLGHYFAGISESLTRDLHFFKEACVALNICPLGSGAVGGTTLPIDMSITTKLLGFKESTRNSIDAIASRDFVLRMLSSASVLGVTLSRLANDLLVWTTSEFDFIRLPDNLVGSSSMMPQKRNVFILEHVKGKSTSPFGSLVSATTAMHSTPFSNSIAVGAEATSHIWKSLNDTIDALVLCRLIVEAVEPNATAMLERAENGYTSATELANQLVVRTGMSFRAAHKAVGEMVRTALERGVPNEQLSEWVNNNFRIELSHIDPQSIARSAEFGGGPGIHSLERTLAEQQDVWKNELAYAHSQRFLWKNAKRILDGKVKNIIGVVPDSGV